MKVSGLSIGDRLENRRVDAVLVITAIEPCGSCPCGAGDISFDEYKNGKLRRRMMTFRQFERLELARRATTHRRKSFAPGDSVEVQGIFGGWFAATYVRLDEEERRHVIKNPMGWEQAVSPRRIRGAGYRAHKPTGRKDA